MIKGKPNGFTLWHDRLGHPGTTVKQNHRELIWSFIETIIYTIQEFSQRHEINYEYVCDHV